MIKRGLISAVLITSLVFPVSTFAATSVSGGSSYYGTSNTSGRSSGGSGSSSPRVRRSATGTTTTSAPGTVSKSLDVAIETTIVSGEAATAGLPKELVDKINAINNGGNLKDILERADLEGYTALGKTSAIVSKDATTKTVKDVKSDNIINIPNLVAGLNKPIVLFYNNATGKWEILTITNIDTTKRDIAVTIPGSGTFIVAYMK